MNWGRPFLSQGRLYLGGMQFTSRIQVLPRCGGAEALHAFKTRVRWYTSQRLHCQAGSTIEYTQTHELPAIATSDDSSEIILTSCRENVSYVKVPLSSARSVTLPQQQRRRATSCSRPLRLRGSCHCRSRRPRCAAKAPMISTISCSCYVVYQTPASLDPTKNDVGY